MGMCGPKDPPFHASPVVHKGPISSKCVSSNDHLLRKFGNFGLYSLNFCPNFSSQASKFGNFQFTSSQIWKFSVHKPSLSETNISSQAPYFGNPGRTHLPEKKKVECPLWAFPGELLCMVMTSFIMFLNVILSTSGIYTLHTTHTPEVVHVTYTHTHPHTPR